MLFVDWQNAKERKLNFRFQKISPSATTSVTTYMGKLRESGMTVIEFLIRRHMVMLRQEEGDIGEKHGPNIYDSTN